MMTKKIIIDIISLVWSNLNKAVPSKADRSYGIKQNGQALGSALFFPSVSNLLNLNVFSLLTYKSVIKIQKSMLEIRNVVTIIAGFQDSKIRQWLLVLQILWYYGQPSERRVLRERIFTIMCLKYIFNKAIQRCYLCQTS